MTFHLSITHEEKDYIVTVKLLHGDIPQRKDTPAEPAEIEIESVCTDDPDEIDCPDLVSVFENLYTDRLTEGAIECAEDRTAALEEDESDRRREEFLNERGQ